MALYSVVFLGSTPIGAPLVGGLAEVAGPRAGLALGGAAALATAAGGWARCARARGPAPAPAPAPAPGGSGAHPPLVARTRGAVHRRWAMLDRTR